MSKLELAILVGAESKEWLKRMEQVGENLEKILKRLEDFSSKTNPQEKPKQGFEVNGKPVSAEQFVEAASGVVSQLIDEASPAPKTEKKSKPAKNQAKMTEPEAAPEVKEETKPEPQAEEPTPENLDDMLGEGQSDEPTIDDVRRVIKAFGMKHGKEKALKLLGKFKATSVQEIKKADYGKFVELGSKYI